MDRANALVKLCEERWRRVSQSQEGDSVAYAKQFLEYLGWGRLEDFDSVVAEHAWTTRDLRHGSLAFLFCGPGELEPPGAIVNRGLDFCAATLAMCRESRRAGIDYALITDLYRSYLYDVATNELLLYSDSPKIFLTELYDEVSRECVEDGSLGELRRAPRSLLARQIRSWQDKWSETIEREPDMGAESADPLMDRLVVMRYFLESPASAQGGLRKRFGAIFGGAKPGEASRYGIRLGEVFAWIHREMGVALYEPCDQLGALLEREHLLAPLLSEFVLISKAKFSIPSILESFNFGDASEKARVRLVPEPNEEREEFLSTRTLATLDEKPLEVDVVEEGYRAIGHWFEKLLQTYDRIGVEYESRNSAPAPADDEGDLMAWSERDQARPEVVQDRTWYAVAKGMRVYCGSARQYRTARLMLYHYVIDACAEDQRTLDAFPDVEAALAERPTLLESEKRWIYEPPPDHASRGWDVV